MSPQPGQSPAATDARLRASSSLDAVLFAEGLVTERMFASLETDALHANHLTFPRQSPGMRPMGSGLELFGRRKDGTEIPIEVSLSPVHTEDGLLVSAVIRDIGERKRIESNARLSAERLTSAVETMKEAFALFDANDRLVLYNSVYRAIVGDSLVGSLVGLPYEAILDAKIESLEFDDDEARDRYRQKRLTDRKSEAAATDIRTRDGRHLRIADSRTVEGGLVETVWDLTLDVRREEELRQARRAADAGNNAKSEFVSSISHELRTPLNAILGFAQLLQLDKKERLSARQNERVAQILRGGEHLLRLIDDILDLSRIEAGHVTFALDAVRVDSVVAEVKRTTEPLASRNTVRVVVEMESAVPRSVVTDRTRFLQILTNLASNAIKYNRPNGEVTIRTELSSPGVVRVSVSDTGIGIPLEKQDKIFQPFQRAGQETGPIEGTGIGLMISKRLAEMMGAVMGFRSTPGEGSVFWVELDEAPPRATSHPSAAFDERALSAGEGEHLVIDDRRLVLYVEDNPLNARFMADLLGTFENIELRTVTTAEEALVIAREALPPVIVMDINLPGMSGHDALRALKADPRTASIPVIALTAAAFERDKERGAEAGFHRYLTKPVNVPALLAVLKSILG